MKTKGLVLFMFLTCSSTILMAQVKFGVKTGLNLSTQSELGMLWDNNDMKIGYSIGATFDYRFHSAISLQSEINYQTTGLSYKNNSENPQEVVTDYDYYNIPLLLKGRFSDQLGLSEKWTVSFYGGPYYSYLRSAEIESKNNGITTSDDYDDFSNSSDWGLVLGGEVSRNISKGELFFDLRYEMGLTDVLDNDDIKNKIIGIGLGYRF